MHTVATGNGIKKFPDRLFLPSAKRFVPSPLSYLLSPPFLPALVHIFLFPNHVLSPPRQRRASRNTRGVKKPKGNPLVRLITVKLEAFPCLVKRDGRVYFRGNGETSRNPFYRDSGVTSFCHIHSATVTCTRAFSIGGSRQESCLCRRSEARWMQRPRFLSFFPLVTSLFAPPSPPPLYLAISISLAA